ncbi:hypothetical protein DPMN_075328 [Dreissena polymorpha]|uniref:Uncharacterized protein n=1 Tax=Dreissena polymorpha TaxID=45954 RepID=A0A9D4BPA8_DREPO|nr:hypothetical protein DPMN_075328 [Dreissena polymorpha]
MPPKLFDEILERISQVISRQDTKIRSAPTPGLKLALTDAFGYREQLLVNLLCVSVQ